MANQNQIDILINAVNNTKTVFESIKQDVKGVGTNIKGIQADFGGALHGAERLANGIKTIAGAVALIKIKGIFDDLAGEAARVESLGTVLGVVAKNANISAEAIGVADKAIQRLGITAEVSRRGLSQFVQAGLNVGDAAKLARASQDLAVLSGENSSDTFRGLTQAIDETSIMMLRFRGINVTNEEAQQKYAVTMGKSVSSLEDWEKKQALLNLVLERSTKLNGIYEASMGDVAKQVSSLERYHTDASVAIGNNLLPAYSNVVLEITNFLRYIKLTADASLASEGAATGLADAVGAIAKAVRTGTEFLVEHSDAVFGLVKAYTAFKVVQGISAVIGKGAGVAQSLSNLTKPKMMTDVKGDRLYDREGKPIINTGNSQKPLPPPPITKPQTMEQLAASKAATHHGAMVLAIQAENTALTAQQATLSKIATAEVRLMQIAVERGTASKAQQAVLVMEEIEKRKIIADERALLVENAANLAIETKRLDIAKARVAEANKNLLKESNKADLARIAGVPPTMARTPKEQVPKLTMLETLNKKVPGFSMVDNLVQNLVGGWKMLGVVTAAYWLIFEGGHKTVTQGLQKMYYGITNNTKGMQRLKAEQEKDRKAEAEKSGDMSQYKSAIKSQIEAEENSRKLEYQQASMLEKLKGSHSLEDVAEADRLRQEIIAAKKEAKRAGNLAAVLEQSGKVKKKDVDVSETEREAFVKGRDTEDLKRNQSLMKAREATGQLKNIFSTLIPVSLEASTAFEAFRKEFQAYIDQLAGSDASLARLAVSMDHFLSSAKNLDDVIMLQMQYRDMVEDTGRALRDLEILRAGSGNAENPYDREFDTKKYMAFEAQRSRIADEAKKLGKSESEVIDTQVTSGKRAKDSLELSSADTRSTLSKKFGFGEYAPKDGVESPEFNKGAALGAYDRAVKNGNVGKVTDDEIAAAKAKLPPAKEGESEQVRNAAVEQQAKIDKVREYMKSVSDATTLETHSLDAINNQKQALSAMDEAYKRIVERTKQYAAAVDHATDMLHQQDGVRHKLQDAGAAKAGGVGAGSIEAFRLIENAKKEYALDMAKITIKEQDALQKARSARDIAIKGGGEKPELSAEQVKKQKEKDAETKRLLKDDTPEVALAKLKDSTANEKKAEGITKILDKWSEVQDNEKAKGNDLPKEDLDFIDKKTKELTELQAPSHASLRKAAEKSGTVEFFDADYAEARLNSLKVESKDIDSKESLEAKETREAELKDAELDATRKRTIANNLRKNREDGGDALRLLEATVGGVAVGAAAGSVLPGLGTVAGGAVGGLSSLGMAITTGEGKAKVAQDPDDLKATQTLADDIVKTERILKEKEAKIKSAKDKENSENTESGAAIVAANDRFAKEEEAIARKSGEERLKVTEKMFEALLKATDKYQETYLGKLKYIHESNKGLVDVASKQTQAGISVERIQENLKFSPNQKVMGELDAAALRETHSAAKTKYEEDVVANKQALDKKLLDVQNNAEAQEQAIRNKSEVTLTADVKKIKADTSLSEPQKKVAIEEATANNAKKLKDDLSKAEESSAELLNNRKSQFAQEQLAREREHFTTVSGLRDQALQKYQEYANKAKELEKSIRDQVITDAAALREIDRTGKSDSFKFRDKKKEMEEYYALAKKRAAEGDLEGAKELAGKGKGIASSLANAPGTSITQARDTARAGYVEGMDLERGFKTKELSNVNSAKQQQLDIANEMTDASNALATSIAKLTSETAISLKPELDAAAEEKLREQIKNAVQEQSAEVSAVLSNTSLEGIVSSVQEALNGKVFDITVNAKVKEGESSAGSSDIPTPDGKPIKKAEGGFINGIGTGTSDSVPAMLSHGEFIVKQDSTAHYGTNFLNLLNSKALHFAEGGVVGHADGGFIRGMADYWEKDNADFNSKKPSTAAQIGRSLNPLTGFGSAIGQFSKGVKEGNGTDIALGTLGAIPAIGSTMKIGTSLAKTAAKHIPKLKGAMKYAAEPTANALAEGAPGFAEGGELGGHWAKDAGGGVTSTIQNRQKQLDLAAGYAEGGEVQKKRIKDSWDASAAANPTGVVSTRDVTTPSKPSYSNNGNTRSSVDRLPASADTPSGIDRGDSRSPLEAALKERQTTREERAKSRNYIEDPLRREISKNGHTIVYGSRLEDREDRLQRADFMRETDNPANRQKRPADMPKATTNAERVAERQAYIDKHGNSGTTVDSGRNYFADVEFHRNQNIIDRQRKREAESALMHARFQEHNDEAVRPVWWSGGERKQAEPGTYGGSGYDHAGRDRKFRPNSWVTIGGATKWAGDDGYIDYDRPNRNGYSQNDMFHRFALGGVVNSDEARKKKSDLTYSSDKQTTNRTATEKPSGSTASDRKSPLIDRTAREVDSYGKSPNILANGFRVIDYSQGVRALANGGFKSITTREDTPSAVIEKEHKENQLKYAKQAKLNDAYDQAIEANNAPPPPSNVASVTNGQAKLAYDYNREAKQSYANNHPAQLEDQPNTIPGYFETPDMKKSLAELKERQTTRSDRANLRDYIQFPLLRKDSVVYGSREEEHAEALQKADFLRATDNPADRQQRTAGFSKPTTNAERVAERQSYIAKNGNSGSNVDSGRNYFADVEFNRNQDIADRKRKRETESALMHARFQEHNDEAVRQVWWSGGERKQDAPGTYASSRFNHDGSDRVFAPNSWVTINGRSVRTDDFGKADDSLKRPINFSKGGGTGEDDGSYVNTGTFDSNNVPIKEWRVSKAAVKAPVTQLPKKEEASGLQRLASFFGVSKEINKRNSDLSAIAKRDGGLIPKFADGSYVDTGKLDSNGVPIKEWREEAPVKKQAVQAPKKEEKSGLQRLASFFGVSSSINKQKEELVKTAYADGGLISHFSQGGQPDKAKDEKAKEISDGFKKSGGIKVPDFIKDFFGGNKRKTAEYNEGSLATIGIRGATGGGVEGGDTPKFNFSEQDKKDTREKLRILATKIPKDASLGNKRDANAPVTLGTRGATGGHNQGGDIPAWLSHGEFRVNADAVSHYGSGLLSAINEMALPKFAEGGMVGSASQVINNENLGPNASTKDIVEVAFKVNDRVHQLQGARSSARDLAKNLKEYSTRNL